nr:MAG TPA: putative outer membrane protein [Caudoviricetes sp.]
MNKKIILTTAAVLAMVAKAGGVKADEFNGDLTKDSIGLTAETGNSTSATEATVSSAQGEHEGNPGNIEGDRAVDEEDPSRGSNATSFAKDGDIIRVENPEVVIDQSKGTGKYQGFTVEYKNVHFPDDLTINEGDKVTLTLPEEVAFQTSFTFDVHNPENAVVGQATADSQAGTVTTVFNDYFKNHPLNKQMSLKMDAKWTDKVQSGQPVSANFNGTVVTAQIGKEQVIGKDELLSKWGSQDENDPSVINWTVRVNYARKVLNYVKIIDEMSENQKLIDNYFEIKNIESVDPWIDKGSAMDLVKSISKSDHGFTITMDRLDHMIYLNYKTKLINAVKDSTNPTNKVELKAETDGATSYSYVQLVGGRGDASGENKPVFEIPNEAPVYDRPSINIEDIPLMPPAPIVEIPEWNGGTVPFDAPILEKPELEIPDEPVKPSPEPKQNQPQPKPEPKQDKPNTPAPKTETKKETVEVVNKGEVKQDEPVEVYNAPAVLPATGSNLGLSLVALGFSVATLAFTLKKKEN